MNKYKESLNCIKEIVIDEHADGYYQPRTVEHYYHEAIDDLNELIEKATPKEPFFKFGVDISMFNGDCFYQNRTSDYWICPNCDGYLCNYGDEDYQGGYCPHCGQALDWSEDDD